MDAACQRVFAREAEFAARAVNIINSALAPMPALLPYKTKVIEGKKIYCPCLGAFHPLGWPCLFGIAEDWSPKTFDATAVAFADHILAGLGRHYVNWTEERNDSARPHVLTFCRQMMHLLEDVKPCWYEHEDGNTSVLVC